MSWQAYIDTQLVASGSIQEAAILSVQDASVWATTPDFLPRAYNAPVTNEDGSESQQAVNEATLLVSYLTTGQRPAAGLRYNGTKYMIVRSNPEPFTVYGKKPRGGICITKTNQAIIIGTFSEDLGHNAGGCNLAVENLGDYLRSCGF